MPRSLLQKRMCRHCMIPMQYKGTLSLLWTSDLADLHVCPECRDTVVVPWRSQ